MSIREYRPSPHTVTREGFFCQRPHRIRPAEAAKSECVYHGETIGHETGLKMVDLFAPTTPSSGQSTLEGLPFDADTMFADHKGVYKARLEKKQRKLARTLPFLKDFLEEGEKLLVVTTAVSPTSFLEQFTTGWIFIYVKRCLLVMTDRRIFHIPATAGYKYRRSIAQIRYGDIESITQKSSKLKIRYKTGASDLFLYLRGAERKKIRALLQNLSLEGTPSSAGVRVHLCPRCTSELVTGQFKCGHCGLEFKSRTKAIRLSIWLPGGGYFYTGHPLLGVGDAIVELALLLGIVISLAPDPDFPEPDIAGVATIGVILVLEKLVTIYHANHFVKEYLPASETTEPAAYIT